MSNFACRVWLYTLTVSHAKASNWAQISGEQSTASVRVKNSPFTKRHGHAIVIGSSEQVFVIGGDSAVQGDQDLRAYPGGGGLHNDVWALSNVEYHRHTSSIRASYRFVMNATWTQMNSGKVPPRNVTYEEWIACASRSWNAVPILGCEDPSKPPGSYRSDSMFSPRRNFAAVALQNELYVLGGRARALRFVPQVDLRGGARLEYRSARWREYTVLKNDVWKSSDAGVTWTLLTPGCDAPQEDLVYHNGEERFQCSLSSSCTGVSACKIQPTRVHGTCVCTMWSSREYHAAAVHDHSIYISGGYAEIAASYCGTEKHREHSSDTFACGSFRKYMNDVWSSSDGILWTALTLSAEFQPRGEHAMIFFDRAFYILGGRQGSVYDASSNRLRNDIWISEDATSWNLHTAQAPWLPRARHSVLALSDELVLMFGETETLVLSDVWTYKANQWTQDFSSETPQKYYVHPKSSVQLLNSISAEDAQRMHEIGIETIQQLAQISLEDTLRLRRDMYHACDRIALAKRIVLQCSKPVPSRLEERNLGWDGCSHYGQRVKSKETNQYYYPDVNGTDQIQVLADISEEAAEIVCRHTPRPRTGQASAVFGKNIILIGGKMAYDTYENDAWLRVTMSATSLILRAPQSVSSDAKFRFLCAEKGCVLEYHLQHLASASVIRSWTEVEETLDCSKWLKTGTYRLRIRAVDVAGNVESVFELHRNEHIWKYKRKLPLSILLSCVCALLVILIVCLWIWKKKRRRALMERYAQRRKEHTSPRPMNAKRPRSPMHGPEKRILRKVTRRPRRARQ